MEITADFLRSIAAAAAAETLPRFRQRSEIVNKLERGFDPVTGADREAERAIRALINRQFPDHGILGEEFGGERLDAKHVWVIDPVDGTRAFISGLPTWGTLVGVLEDGDAVAGLMAQPFTGELYFADRNGSHYEGPGGRCELAVSRVTELKDATIFTTTPALFQGDARRRYDALEAQVKLARYGTDCYGFAMVAAGHAEIVVDPGLQPYDIVALIPIIERAGGIVTTFDGKPAETGGDIIAAATPELHQAAMRLLAP
ncbi:MAG: histidinol-phosphatase [Rhizobiaceae bacterium]